MANIVLLRIEQAAQKYNIPEQDIHCLIEDGKLETFDLLENSQTTCLVAADDVAAIAADRQIKRSQFSRLEGVPIGVSQAAIKYGFHPGTISQWVQDGHIREIGPDPTHKLRRLINEADVAYAAALRDLKGLRKGRSLFD